MKADTYKAQLTETRNFLRGTPRTAAEVAERFDISTVAAYERLEALRNQGRVERLGKTKGPEGKKGPKARLWRAALKD